MASRGKSARSKGNRIENEIVHLHDEIPCAAEKISRTGHAGPDLKIADALLAEVKARSEGFRLLERWLGTNDLLFLRTDGERFPRVVMPWRVYSDLLSAWVSRQA